ncbi:MAG UNVERIFIED_CONTAM: AAA family ATPase [Rickettsiaceae bacterium]|jgi:phage/plasmid primase-like uncharacterized protein
MISLRASSLVRETLQSDRIEVLYTEDALATKYFTTKEVRAEELKLMRLSEYVYGQQNGTQGLIGNNNWRNNLKTQGKEIKLSEEQEKALSHLLLGEGGIRILRGRAGTGKSHVLGNLASIANKYGQNVIGLAPTHKAKDELVKVGFHNADTVKGMLFKLYNGRFHLPKNSLLVVDEAGMIGNDDYIELVRIAANKQCDLILAGDERQIASIQRGGMFEIFADKFGSTTLFDIQRQITNWGREVATSFSIGDVLSGINVLKEQGRIIENRDKVESMEQLLQDWNVSEHSLENKIILAVKNKDVDALNIGARQYLKANGTLSGDEISVGGNHFMSGDIVMIRETNKELGVINGDSGRVLRVSKEEFVLELIAHNNSQKQKKISFNPRDFSGFKHAYATTIFKAQGASIFEVFVFHDGLAGLRNSYVSLSRHIKELKLYINTQATKSLNHLVKQMGIDPEISSSLGYYTKAELEKKYSKPQENAKGLISSIVNTGREFFGSRLREFKDKHIPDFGYYNYEAIPLNKAHVEKVLDNGYIEEEELEVIAATSLHGNLAIQAKGGGVITSKGSKLTPKQRFYAKVDKANSTSDLVAKRAMWDRETEQLKHEAKFRADEIARNLLGSPNEKLSNNKTLRFGESGKIAVRISGDRAGQWYDFAQDKGGDIFSLVSETIGGNFKSSAEHLRSMLGLKQSSNLHLVEKHRNSNLTEKHIREKEAIAKAEKAKQAMVLKLIEKAKPIKAGTIAYRYLLEHRGISCELSSDLCSTDIWAKEITKEKGAYLPTLIAFARDKYGEITGGQQIFLDKHRCGKANIDLAKKSFGKIAGSFVYLDEVPLAKTNTQDIIKLIGNETKAHITIIAEGLETGLSVKQALNNYSSIKDIDIKVLCSLGISNIKNYMPITGEKIIIAADNDGENSPTSKTIQNAKEALCQRNALVEIVMPQAMGDFNDVIRENDGESKIQAAFARAILKQTAKNLDDFFRSKGDGKNIYDYLDKQELADLNLMREYGVSELCIVEAYRGHKFNGKLVFRGDEKAD